MAFNRDNNRSGGNRDFGNRSYGSDRERPQMFQATCASCGKDCEVPFRPTGSKPVYCRDCFKNNGGGDVRRSDDRGGNRPQFGNRTQFGNRSNPERSNEQPQTQSQPQYDRQFAALNAKLDTILKMITPIVPVETELDEKIIQDIVEEIEVKKPAAKTVSVEKKTKPAKKVTTKKAASSKKK